MNFEEMKSTLENMLKENYADFTKAIISIEKDISDPDLLEQVYQAYMDDDSISGLLHSNIDAIIGAIESNKSQLSTDNVELIGNVTKNVEVKVIPRGDGKDFKVDNFSIARNDDQGNTHFTNVTAYNGRADFAEQLKKGDFVQLTGQMKYDEYEGKLFSNLVVKNIKILKTRKKFLEEKVSKEEKPSTLGALKEYSQQTKSEQTKPKLDKGMEL
ncbi:TPA: single-stranded DNA-binding protein [Streptococcus suis]